MNIIKIEHHIKHLESKHWHLDKQIDLMERHGKYSDAEMQYLKRERLHLRDQIEDLKKRMMDENSSSN